MKLEDVILRDTRANQPAASTVAVATLYGVTDEGDIIERSNGVSWDAYSPALGTGTVTNTGTLASGAIVKGNGGVDVSTTTTGTGILTALANNVGSAGAPVVFNGALGTPSSGTLTNCTSVPVAQATGVLPGVNGGGLVLLEQHTASASASLDFTTWYSSSYDSFVIMLVNVLPATNATDLRFRVSTNGGSSYDSSANYYYGTTYVSNAGVTGALNGDGVTAATLFTAIANSLEGVNGHALLFNPGSSTQRKSMAFDVIGPQATAAYRGAGYCTWGSTTAVNAFQFYYSSGNVASGTIRVYGVAK